MKLDQRKAEYEEAKRKACADRGHEKAIEQLQRKVDELREQVRKHCNGQIDAVDMTAFMLLPALLQALLGMPPIPAPI